MTIKPLEPPQDQDPNSMSIHRLPNGDVVLTRSGLSVQYQEPWLMKASLGSLVSLLRGVESHPIAQEIFQKHYAATAAQNNPYAKPPKLSPPKILTYEYDPPVVFIKQQALDDYEDDVPQIEDKPMKTKLEETQAPWAGLNPKRLVDID